MLRKRLAIGLLVLAATILVLGTYAVIDVRVDPPDRPIYDVDSLYRWALGASGLLAVGSYFLWRWSERKPHD